MIAGKAKRALRATLYRLLQRNWIRKALILFPFFHRLHSGAHNTHPIDRHYGIDTSSFFPADLIARAPSQASEINSYLGSSPDLQRRILSHLPALSEHSFIDLGCGKGRALAVASEFPFKAIIGVELSPEICAIARKNAKIIAQRHPERPKIIVHQGDATRFSLPDGKLAVFCYNSVRRELTGDIVRLLERHVATGNDVIFIYVNPEWAEQVDASQSLTRWSSVTLGEDCAEIGHGLARNDLVAQLWRNIPA
jgi:SAM-dependent methyltransferase